MAYIILQLGLLYAIPALAVSISFRVVGFPDLTPDGSFTLGAAVSAVFLLHGFHPLLAMLVALVAGACAGFLTAVLHTRLGVSKLLSGIIIMTMLYSVSLRVMGTSNLSLRRLSTFLGSLIETRGNLMTTATIAVFCSALVLIVWSLLKLRIGLFLRAVGDSNSALTQRGVRTEPLYLIGLAITNGLAALGGVFVGQFQGFVDIYMGSGLVIISLAAIIIGETIIRPERVITLITAPVLGMIIYQAVIAIALRLRLAATDVKVATAILVLLFVAVDRVRFRLGIANRQIGNRDI